MLKQSDYIFESSSEVLPRSVEVKGLRADPVILDYDVRVRLLRGVGPRVRGQKPAPRSFRFTG